MVQARLVPDDPLGFIKGCVGRDRVFWTHHVKMRFKGRSLSAEAVLQAVESFEVIEDYAKERFHPAYLLLGIVGARPFHVVFAVDLEGDSIRATTVYWPSPDEWEPDMRTRRRIQK